MADFAGIYFDIHLFPTNFGQSACNSVKVQPISTLPLPNHARPAAELPNRRNCLHYFRNALSPKLAVKRCSLRDATSMLSDAAEYNFRIKNTIILIYLYLL